MDFIDVNGARTVRTPARADPARGGGLMHGHDIVVIGSSAGGIRALTTLFAALPAHVHASFCVVQHVSPDQPSLLPQILSDVGALPAVHPADGEQLRRGRVYVASPDHHLLMSDGFVRVMRGPKENRFRPSIDATFRSAARVYGPRVIGVVLTGHLGDGTVGLQAIRKRGGISIVQNPTEAEYPSMPSSALRYAKVDYCVPLAEIPDLLLRLVGEPPAAEELYPVPRDVEVESKIAEQLMNTDELLDNVEKIGRQTVFTCPECHGVIWQIGDEEPVRLRCHVGHSFTADIFQQLQTEKLENALWTAVRVMDESANFYRERAAQLRDDNLLEAQSHEEQAAKLAAQASALRQLVVRRFSDDAGSLPEADE
jgi:two-component system chemotaxis response regulator CheB